MQSHPKHRSHLPVLRQQRPRRDSLFTSAFHAASILPHDRRYGKRALMKIPSLEQYEREAAAKVDREA
jgi:hypothetical protein